jgi:AcrR family transcriptional regulator
MTEETEQRALPDQVTLLWGLRGASRRGPKSTLSVQDITRAAIAVADAEGLTAVSMARVAAELGNSTMALYRHVRSKDELLLLMWDSAMDDPPEFAEDGDWRDKLAEWSRALVARARQHPWFVRIPINGPPVGPGNLVWFDRALGAFSDTSLAEWEKVALVTSLLTFVQGAMRLRADLIAGYAENPEAFDGSYGRTLSEVVDPRRLPALYKVLQAGVFADGDDFETDVDTDFEFGLARVLDGMEFYLDSRADG